MKNAHLPSMESSWIPSTGGHIKVVRGCVGFPRYDFTLHFCTKLFVPTQHAAIPAFEIREVCLEG